MLFSLPMQSVKLGQSEVFSTKIYKEDHNIGMVSEIIVADPPSASHFWSLDFVSSCSLAPLSVGGRTKELGEQHFTLKA